MVEITLERKIGETELDYHKRLVYGKLVDKTLADYDFSELSQYVYGKDYSPDVARRLMYGSKYTLDLLEQAKSSGEARQDAASEIDGRILELEKERQRFFDQRREYKKLVSQDGRWEYLVSMLSEAAERMNQELGLTVEMPKPELRDGNGEAVLVFSDWHYGMVTSNVFNVYNTQICANRVNRVVEGAVRRILAHGCKILHVVVLGDLFHGAIHTSARVASEELVCDQLMQSSEILAQAINTLSQYVDCVKVYTTYGNHGRTVPNKKENLHRDNMERIIPWWLEQRFQTRDDIEIYGDSGTEFRYLDVCGHCICATHGDLDTLVTAPRLIGALTYKRFSRDVELILLGDKHHRASREELGVDVMLCGSLCGTDDYANEHRLYSSPSQMLLIVTPEDGVDAEYRLRCN